MILFWHWGFSSFFNFCSIHKFFHWNRTSSVSVYLHISVLSSFVLCWLDSFNRIFSSWPLTINKVTISSLALSWLTSTTASFIPGTVASGDKGDKSSTSSSKKTFKLALAGKKKLNCTNCFSEIEPVGIYRKAINFIFNVISLTWYFCYFRKSSEEFISALPEQIPKNQSTKLHMNGEWYLHYE